MTVPLHTADAAFAALAAAEPLLVDVVPAREVVPHLAEGGLTHAGPPIHPVDMCAPMQAALATAAALEGLAPDPARALERAHAGALRLLPNHDAGGVGPMAGVVSGSMPVLVARDEATGRPAGCPLNEGSGRVLRYGADGPDVVDRLHWMRDVLGPALHAALARTGPVDLVSMQAEALELGDECHHRTEAGTHLLAERLAGELPPEVDAFIRSNGQFFLNVAMVAAKLALVCASGVPGSALVTAIARNGVEVGIRLSGTGDRWFTGPAALPEPAALYPDLGDSTIVEAYGLGALAVAASPLAAPSVGLEAADVRAITAGLRPISAGEHPRMCLGPGGPPAPLGVDARAVVEHGIRPPVHTGIAHREPGIGQIGGGVTLPPMEAFAAAVAALETG
jgi:hypothetical protein